MEALDYELLMNNIYGKNPATRGIDADMYCQMLEEHQNMITRKMYDTQQERILEYKRAFVIIRDCVQLAITDGAKKILLGIKEEDLNTLEKLAHELTPDFFDKSALYKIILSVNEIFSKYGFGKAEYGNLLQLDSKMHISGSFKN